MDLKGCPAADFAGVEYIGGGDGTVVFERLGEEGNCGGGAPWVVSGCGSRCIGKGCDEVRCPGSFPEEFTVRAVAESGAEGSAYIIQLREEVFLLLFGVGQDLAEMGWDGFVEQGVSGFFESWAEAFAYPM